jgi:hypothetical protein
MEKMDRRVERGVHLIKLSIILFLIKEKGETTIEKISSFTGLNQISTYYTADFLVWMSKNKILTIKSGKVSASVPYLKTLLEKEKSKYPENHGNSWSDKDIISVAQWKILGYSTSKIAKSLERTERAVISVEYLIKKAYRMIALFETNPVMREFAIKENHSSK